MDMKYTAGKNKNMFTFIFKKLEVGYKMKKRVFQIMMATLLWSAFAGSALALPPVIGVGGDSYADVLWSIPKFSANGSPMEDFKGVYIYRSTRAGGPYLKLTSKLYTTKNIRRFRDVNLMNGVPYYYVLKAYDDVGNGSELSPELKLIPDGDMVDPNRVLNLTAVSNNPGEAELNWDPSTDNTGIALYRVYRSYTEIHEEYLTGKNYHFKKNEEGQYIYDDRNQKEIDFTTTVKGIGAMYQPIATLSGNVTSFTDKTVDNGVLYYYCVTAVDAATNESLASNSPKVTIKGTRTKPPMIRSVMEDTYDIPKNAKKIISVAIAGESGCVADFTIDTLVERSPMVETAQPGVYIGYYTVGSNDNGADLLVNGRLRAKINDRVTTLATEIEASTGKITVDTVPPAVPNTVRAKAETSPNIRLLWTPPTPFVDIKGFNVYRDTQPLGADFDTKTKLNEKLLANEVRIFLDATGFPNSLYFYGIAAVDTAGNQALGLASGVRVAKDVTPPIVSKVYENTLGVTKQEDAVIRITLLGEPHCTATASIGNNIHNLSLTEILIGQVNTGTYVGNYTVKAGDDVRDAEVVGFLKDYSNNLSDPVSSKYTDSNAIERGMVTIVTTSDDVIPPIISSVEVSSASPHIKGDILELTMTGEPGGTGFFDIGTMKRGVLMIEDDTQPGTYSGSYIIETGDNYKAGAITAWLADPAGNLTSSNSPQMVTVDTSVHILITHVYQEEQLWVDVDSDIIVDIKATLTDAKGNAAAGRIVDFDLVGGFGDVLDVTGTTDSHGSVFSRFDPGKVVETAYISAEDVETGIITVTAVKMMKQISLNLHLKGVNQRLKTSNGSYYLSVKAKPRRITANGETVCVITATVRKLADDGEMKFDDEDNDDEKIEGEMVSFFILGTLNTDGSEANAEDDALIRGHLEIDSDYYDPVTGKAYTDDNGEAKAIYTSGTKTGMVIFQVVTGSIKVGQPIGENTHIVQIPGGVEFLEISADKETLDAVGPSEFTKVTVLAEDSFHNPVDHIQVQFHIADTATGDVGSIVAENSSGGLTNDEGKATAYYYAGTKPGIVEVVADVRSQDRIDEAVMLYSMQQYYEAIETFNQVLDYWAYQEENWTDDMRFILGYNYELTADYTAAVEQYDEVIDYYFGGPWLDNAIYRKGQTMEKAGSYAEAAEAYKLIVEDYPESDLADNALFRIAILYENLEYYMIAKQVYTKLVLDYPESTLVPSAQAAVEELDLRGIKH